MTKRFYRFSQSILLLVTFAVLMGSFYLEYAVGLTPCPLCLMQRFCVFALSALGLSAICLMTLKRARLITKLQIVFAMAGLFFSLRHIWLQKFVVQHTSSCLPGFDVMMHYLPWKDIFHALLWGAGDCAEVQSTWLGLSLPMWAALYFIGYMLFSVVVLMRLRKPV